MVSETELVDKITSRAKDIGVQVWLHAADLDSARQVGIDAAEPVVTASVFKVPVGLELARQAADGAVDLAERVTVAPGRSTSGSYGLATFHQEVTMSWHDLAVLMIGVSDNIATDLILERVGKAAVAESWSDWSFRRRRSRTIVRSCCTRSRKTSGSITGTTSGSWPRCRPNGSANCAH